MQFEKINEGGARRASDGAEVQIVGPDVLEYRRADRTILVGLGYDPTTRVIEVYASTAAWSDACGNPLANAEKELLASDLSDALSLLTGRFDVR